MPEKPSYEELEQRIRELELSKSDYKRRFEEQRQTEQRYQNLFENMLHEVHIWEVIYDDDDNIKTWKLVDANPAALKSWDKDLSEIVGKITDEIFPNSNATELFMPVVNKIFEDGAPHAWETYFPGTNQYLHMISIPLGKYFISTGLDITDRRKIEETLLESNEKYRNLVSNLPGTAYQFVLNQEGDFSFKYMGDNCVDLFGYKASDILENHDLIFDLIPEPDAGIVNQAIQNSARTMSPYNVEHRIIKNNGETVWIHAISTPRRRNDDEIIWDGIGLNITERKQIEMLIEKRNTDLRLAQSIASIGTWTLDPEVGIPEWSDEIYRIYERDPKLGPHPLSDCKTIYKGKCWERFNNAIQGAIKDGIPYDIELRLELASGNVKWVHAICEPETEQGPKGRKLRGTIQDITERKQAEETLLKSEGILKDAQEIAHIGSWEYNVKTEELEWSEELFKIYGLDASVKPRLEDAIDNIHPEDKQKAVETFNKAINEHLPYEMEYRINRKDGEERYIHAIGKISTDERNDLLRVYGTGQDITERKRNESEKENLQLQLRQAQKMESIGNLAGGIAHDFNNILASVIGFTELALDETQKGTVLEDSLQEVYSAGKRAKDLVGQILAFARQSDEKKSPIQPRTLVKEVLHFIRSTIPTTIEIQQDINNDSWIWGNATQVHQVLMNLCTNAAHAMDEAGGILGVSLKDVVIEKVALSRDMKPGVYIEIKVSDTGDGISPEIIGSIFEPYFTTKGPGEGTGMGLAMVQGVVESYGGKITVDSQLGKGTTFTIYLPITKKRSSQGAYVPEELPTGTERILLVDDEAPIAKMGSQILERLGYSVTMRTSSIEALELFQAKPNDFNLVVTDMTMPNMTGDKLAVELMKIRPDVPVILCTGYSKKISDETASAIGIKAFAYKPVVKADLAKTVRKVLNEATKIEK